MGADNSKPCGNERTEAQAKEAALQEQLRMLARKNAELLETQRLEQLHREQRAREDEKLRQARADWQRQEAARLQEENRQLREQQAQAQRSQQQQWQQWPQPAVQPPLQQVPQPLFQQVPPPLFHRVPPPLFHQAPQQQQRIGQPLLQHAPPPQQTQAPTPHVPGPSLPSASSVSRTSKSVISPRDSTSATDTKVVRQAKTRSRSTSVHRAPLKATLVEWKDTDYIQETHGTSVYVAENIISLFQAKNTIPFIARYRKDVTLGMDVDQLRNVKTTYERGILMKQKANALINTIFGQGQWAAKFCTLVHKTKSLNELEWMRSIFQEPTSSRLEKARLNGLATPAEAIIEGRIIDPIHFYVKQGTNGLNSKREVMDGIVYILADMIFKSENAFKKMKALRKKRRATILVTDAKPTAKENKNWKTKDVPDKSKYAAYDNFSSPESKLEPYQIWEIIRGEELKILSVSVDLPAEFETDFKEFCAREYENACCASTVHKMLLTEAFDYVWETSIKGSIRKQIMYELRDRAEVALVADFVKDVKELFLTQPVRGAIVIGIHPGVSDGCKLAVVSDTGEVLETETIHPHDEDNPRGKIEAERILAGMILLHKCSLLALGNGAGYEKTERFLGELFEKPAFENLKVTYRIVDEKAASLYSKSNEASAEFPNRDISIVSAISVARRLQDPMAELTKMDSMQLCNAIRRHDIPTQLLVGKLNAVITEVVSFVGVDVNTAPVSLLRRVAGLNESKAKSIIEWRKSSGPFRSREDLKKVRGICEKTFEQCAGFIRIMPETVVRIDESISADSLNHLDRTSIHPEYYDTARAFLTAAKCNLRQFGTKAFIFGVTVFADQKYSALAEKLNTTVETMKMIIEGLSMGNVRDVKGKPDRSKSPEKLNAFDGMKIGDVLTGVVRSRAPFGLFVDVGLGKHALLHNNNMGGATLNNGQRIEVKVSHVEKKRGRIGLSYIKSV